METSHGSRVVGDGVRCDAGANQKAITDDHSPSVMSLSLYAVVVILENEK